MKIKYLFIIIVLLIASVSKAQIVNIPDPIFKAELINAGVDTNGDGEIQVSEAIVVNLIDVSYSPILSLEGIQSFINLEVLRYSNNWNDTNVLTEIDLTQNHYLTRLDLQSNDINYIDLSQNTNLEQLNVTRNHLISLDVSQNINLTHIDAVENEDNQGNSITSLDFSQNIHLVDVDVVANNLSSLNLRNGNNQNMTKMWSWMNPNLNCILVDDENMIFPECHLQTSGDGWCKDLNTVYGEDCILGGISLDFFNINIYPNPVQNVLNIDAEAPNYYIRIYNLQGQLLIETKNNQIDVSLFSSGLYLASIIIEEKNIIKKFIKD